MNSTNADTNTNAAGAGDGMKVPDWNAARKRQDCGLHPVRKEPANDEDLEAMRQMYDVPRETLGEAPSGATWAVALPDFVDWEFVRGLMGRAKVGFPKENRVSVAVEGCGTFDGLKFPENCRLKGLRSYAESMAEVMFEFVEPAVTDVDADLYGTIKHVRAQNLELFHKCERSIAQRDARQTEVRVLAEKLNEMTHKFEKAWEDKERSEKALDFRLKQLQEQNEIHNVLLENAKAAAGGLKRDWLAMENERLEGRVHALEHTVDRRNLEMEKVERMWKEAQERAERLERVVFDFERALMEAKRGANSK